MVVQGEERERLAQRLRELLIEARDASGLTQAQLAAAVGKSQSFVSNYERGQRRLDVAEFILMCRALGIDAQEMVGRLA